jgi:hypothetical protein
MVFLSAIDGAALSGTWVLTFWSTVFGHFGLKFQTARADTEHDHRAKGDAMQPMPTGDCFDLIANATFDALQELGVGLAEGWNGEALRLDEVTGRAFDALDGSDETDSSTTATSPTRETVELVVAWLLDELETAGVQLDEVYADGEFHPLDLSGLDDAVCARLGC